MSKQRILIIDDEPDMVTLLSKGFEAYGYEVITAVNGWDGLALARIEKPNLILLDSLMPKMDGPTTLASLKAMKETKQIPVVVLTALSGKEHITDALQNGASDYIVKPFDLHSLLEKVSNVLRFGHPTETHATAVPKDRDKISLTTPQGHAGP
jgi:DNA-binding response OmpR family regulator